MTRYRSYKKNLRSYRDTRNKIDILTYFRELDISIEEMSNLSESRVYKAIEVLGKWHIEKTRQLAQRKEIWARTAKVESLQLSRRDILEAARRKTTFLQRMFGAKTPPDIMEKLNCIDSEISSLLYGKGALSTFQYSTLEHWVNENELSRVEKILERLTEVLPRLIQKRLDRDNAKIAREKVAAEKKQLDKAAAAAYFDKTRVEAESVKRKIREQVTQFLNCPYCFGPLGGEPNADHIHPVSRGGLSTIENMVYVCKSCNSKKYNLTLREFILRYKLNRDRIEITLDKMGKRF